MLALWQNHRCSDRKAPDLPVHIGEIIRRGSLSDLREAMAGDESEGMMTMDSALFHLYEAGLITIDEALATADSKVNLEVRLRLGGSMSAY